MGAPGSEPGDATVSQSEILTLVIAGAGTCIAAFVIASGTSLMASARSAKTLMERSTSMTGVRTDVYVGAEGTSPPAAGAPAALSRAVTSLIGPPAGPQSQTDIISDAPAYGDNASQQTFALLNHYYAANISQGTAIFWASLLSMSIGFAIIFTGIVIATVSPTAMSGMTALVTAIAGILSQFVGATFLVALRSTQSQATTYAQSLVELRMRDIRVTADATAIELGLRLLGEIETGDGQVLADQMRARLALGLILKDGAPEIVIPPPATPPVDDDGRAGMKVERRGPRIDSVSSDTPVPAPAPPLDVAAKSRS